MPPRIRASGFGLTVKTTGARLVSTWSIMQRPSAPAFLSPLLFNSPILLPPRTNATVEQPPDRRRACPSPTPWSHEL